MIPLLETFLTTYFTGIIFFKILCKFVYFCRSDLDHRLQFRSDESLLTVRHLAGQDLLQLRKEFREVQGLRHIRQEDRQLLLQVRKKQNYFNLAFNMFTNLKL